MAWQRSKSCACGTGSGDDRNEVRCPLINQIIIISSDNAEEKERTSEIITRDVEHKKQDIVCGTWSRELRGTWRTTTGVGGGRCKDNDGLGRVGQQGRRRLGQQGRRKTQGARTRVCHRQQGSEDKDMSLDVTGSKDEDHERN